MNLKQASNMLLTRKGVQSANKVKVATFQDNKEPVMVTYDSGAGGSYTSK